MISVIVPTFNDEARLVSCLAPLVPAAMDGFVRELIIIDGGSTDATLEIADDAGALILKGEGDRRGWFALGTAAAKGPWLLLLDPGVRLEFGWEAAAKQHMNGPKGSGRFRLKRSDGGWLSSLSPPKERAQLMLKGGEGGDRGVAAAHRLATRIGDRNVGRLLDAAGWV